MALFAGASLHPIRVPYTRRVAWSDTVEDHADFLLLCVRDVEGGKGVAEITTKPTWSGHTSRSLSALLQEVLLPRMAGVDLAEPAEVRRALARVPGTGDAARALLDNALHDLRFGLSAQAAEVQVCWTVTRAAPAAMAADAARMVELHGFGALKVKGGQGIETDLAAIAEIRTAVGNGVKLTVDANGAYAPEDAVEYVARLAQLNVEAIEDPTLLRPDASFGWLQEAAGDIPVLVDAACTSEDDCAAFLEAGARAFGVKPSRDGVTRSGAIAGMAAARGGAVSIGLFGETSLGALAPLALAVRQRGDSMPCEIATFLLFGTTPSRLKMQVHAGAVRLPSVARVADAVDWDAVCRLAPA